MVLLCVWPSDFEPQLGPRHAESDAWSLSLAGTQVSTSVEDSESSFLGQSP